MNVLEIEFFEKMKTKNMYTQQENSREQTAIVCFFYEAESRVNELLKDGWLVVAMTSESPTSTQLGRIFVVLERTKLTDSSTMIVD